VFGEETAVAKTVKRPRPETVIVPLTPEQRDELAKWYSRLLAEYSTALFGLSPRERADEEGRELELTFTRAKVAYERIAADEVPLTAAELTRYR
jgi:hypothetical protein